MKSKTFGAQALSQVGSSRARGAGGGVRAAPASRGLLRAADGSARRVPSAHLREASALVDEASRQLYCSERPRHSWIHKARPDLSKAPASSGLHRAHHSDAPCLVSCRVARCSLRFFHSFSSALPGCFQASRCQQQQGRHHQRQGASP